MNLNYKYCPECKGDLVFIEEHYNCSKCGQNIYLNSKPCATILPIKDGKVLLTKRKLEPYKGDWDTIGGFLKTGEHPEVGAIRETLEETGLNVKLTSLFGIYMDKYGENGYDTLGIVYLAEIIDGVLEAKDDVAELIWVDIKTGVISSHFKSVETVFADLKKHFNL